MLFRGEDVSTVDVVLRWEPYVKKYEHDEQLKCNDLFIKVVRGDK